MSERKSAMNLRESKIKGLISIKLGGMNFERQLSEKER
jgi:hypothetical protein